MAEKPVILAPEILAALRCPRTGSPLRASDDGHWLVADEGGWRYPIVDGVPHLLASAAQATKEQK